MTEDAHTRNMSSAGPHLDMGETAARPGGESGIDIRSELLLLWRWRGVVIAGTLVFVFPALVIAFVVPSSYQATATVFINPPLFEEAKQPSVFSIEAYERLAGSEFIRNQLLQQLGEKKLVGTGPLPARLSTSIYPSREPGKPYLPLIGLTAECSTPEMAQQIANAWAKLFVDEETRLTAAGRAGSVDFVIDEFPKSSARVAQAQRTLKKVTDEQAKAMSTLKAQAAVDFKGSRQRNLEYLAVSLEEQLFKTRLEQDETARAVTQLEQEVKSMSPVIELSKAITDDALWQTLGRSNGVSGVNDALSTSRLKSQAENTAYTKLAGALAEARVRYASLKGRSDTLAAELGAVRRDAQEVRADVLKSEASIDQLQREQEVESGPYERGLEEVEAQFKELADRIAAARIAEAEAQSRLQVGGLAPVPHESIGRNVPGKVGFAGLVGLCLSLVAVWLFAKGRG